VTRRRGVHRCDFVVVGAVGVAELGRENAGHTQASNIREQGHYQSAPAEIGRVAKALERESAWLDSIAKALEALK
jgi:hypothetical protein